MSKDVVDFMRNASWEELGPILQIVADRVNESRRGTGGNTPRPIWRACVELGPSYACIEIVLWVKDDSGETVGVALKKREMSDQGWAGSEHVNGCALRPNDDLARAQERLLDELTDDACLREQLRTSFESRHAFIEVHREDPERSVNCMTAVWEAWVPLSAMTLLKPGFVFRPLSQMSADAIVDHHQTTLADMYASRLR